MPISIYDLLQQVPSDTEQIVSRARTRFNASVRQILRQETGLRLTTGRGTEDETQETHAIRVYVEAGVPAQIEGMRFNDDKWLPILLAPRRSELQLLHRSTRLVGKDLISLLPKNITEEGCFAGIDEKLLTTHDFAEHLLKISQSFDLVKELHAVEDDILGEYRWGVDRQGQASASIRLYWGVIGLIARALGVSVEGMTVKVLAHELAHAYTHLGADIDGYRWSSKDFSNSKRAVKEGLAQYYTRQLVGRLAVRMPEAQEAYQQLLPHQPPDYQVQERWIEDGASAEHIRLAMMLFRRNSGSTLEEFEEFLKRAKLELGQPHRAGQFPMDLEA